jgi:arylsulfatase A-like enzyme
LKTWQWRDRHNYCSCIHGRTDNGACGDIPVTHRHDFGILPTTRIKGAQRMIQARTTLARAVAQGSYYHELGSMTSLNSLHKLSFSYFKRGLNMMRTLFFIMASIFTFAGTSGADTRPNFIVINTDDMREDQLAYMAQTQALLVNQGALFTNAFVVDSLCCPSRATLLRGQQTHNHGVLSNSSPTGGYGAFHDKGLENSTIATWLHDAGYDTVLLGKYFNGYTVASAPLQPPPGWSEWYAIVSGGYYKLQLNQNGVITAYGSSEQEYSTDVLRDLTLDFLDRHASGSNPFFIYVAPWAPHSPSTPAKRHQKALPGLTHVHSASFNEADVSDKPQWLQAIAPLTTTQIKTQDKNYVNSVKTLQAVDEMIGALVARLSAHDLLDNTYILFTSDNGIAYGEHRLTSKTTAYDEDVGVPFVIRGPGIVPGSVYEQFALNMDIAPTLAELAGVQPGHTVDGRSLVGLLASAPGGGNPDERFIIERMIGGGAAQVGYSVPAYTALRTHDYLYVSYSTGETELYDMIADPYQLNSIHAVAAPELVEQLNSWLDVLTTCAGVEGCRPAAEMAGQ